MNREDEQKLLDATLKLLKYNKQAYDQYDKRTKKEGYETDFYNEVKPFADEVLATAEQWQKLAYKWLESQSVNNLYPMQIKNTVDNLNIISVKAFQKDTRKKRFLETIKSVDYVLKNIVEQLK